jgi:hypothetical protein
MHRDALAADNGVETTVDLAEDRGDCGPEDIGSTTKTSTPPYPA